MNVKDRVLTGDIEAVGLLPNIREGHREDLHVIHLKDYHTGELFTFFDDFDDRINAVWLDEYEEDYKQGDIAEGIKWMEECELLIFQNIGGFDAPGIKKTYGKFDRNNFQRTDHDLFPFLTADTLVMSQLLNPERRLDPAAYQLGLGNIGPHSIAAHGIRMGRHKPDHEDWTHLSKEMLHRVEEDVEIGEDFFTYLMNEWTEQEARPNKLTGKNIEDAYWCELRMAFAMSCQAQRGFAIDVKLISEIIFELDEEIDSTINMFMPHMPMRIKMQKHNDRQVEKDAACIQVYNTPERIKIHGGIPNVEYENYMYNGTQRGSYAASYWNLTKKNGEYLKNVTKYIPEARGFMQDHENPPVQGPFTPLVWEDIPLGNRDAVKQILFKHGWKGVTYNEAETDYITENDGELPKPWAGKIDAPSLDRWEASSHDVPEWCKGIARWYILSSRRTQLLNRKDTTYYDTNGKWPRQMSKLNECRGILPKARCFSREDFIWYKKTAQEFYEVTGSFPTTGHWRVPAEAFPCATNTFRMRHKVVVNIPSRGLYGKEMRRSFIAGPGKLLLGCDGSGLELRMLAHFMNDPEFTDIILNGDVHTYNQEKAGFNLDDTTEVFSSARDMAKKFIYMFLYGASVPALARDMGLTRKKMASNVEDFKDGLPALADLMSRVESSGSRFGYLLSIDGRWGRIRTKHHKLAIHTVLNVLLQMTGSLIMKWAHCKAEDMCVEQGVIDDVADFPIVAHQHDEGQMEVEESECDVMHYVIDPFEGAWKEEDKRQHIDEDGKIWSAPVKGVTKEGQTEVRRYYHPIGDNYCKALTWAGEEFGLRCETAGEYKIGESWEETH